MASGCIGKPQTIEVLEYPPQELRVMALVGGVGQKAGKPVVIHRQHLTRTKCRELVQGGLLARRA